MNLESERELAVVMMEEKAKLAIGDEEYSSLPYEEWVERLKSVARRENCTECGAAFDIDDPSEEMWAWFVAPGDGAGGSPSKIDLESIEDVEFEEDELEEMEVVQFFCERCTELDEDARIDSHPKTWGALIFRREATGTFEYDDEEWDEDDE